MVERLHLDLVHGARADMIAGALLAVGAPVAAAQEALARVGLGRVDVVAARVARCGLAAMRCRLLWNGEDLDGPPPSLTGLAGLTGRPNPVQPGSRRRHPTPRPRMDGSSRAAPPLATIAGVQGDQGLAGVVGEASDRERQPREVAATPKRARVPRGAPREPAQWLDGADARASDLLDVVRQAPLPTVVKALALKSTRRLVEALAAVTSASNPRLSGVRAARILGNLVVGAALIDALSPASITASPVGLSTTAGDDSDVPEHPHSGGRAGQGLMWPTPSPWLLEVLAGVPVVEDDEAHGLADVAGAALAWSIVHRFGARGLTVATRQGCGASAADSVGRALVARALMGPPAVVSTRAGTKEIIAAVVVEGRVPSAGLADLAPLRHALVQAGAGDIEVGEVDVLGSSGADRCARVRVLVSASAVDAATAALWRAGAEDVAVTWVERRHAGVEDVTVPVGRGRSKASVRVHVVTNGAEILRVDPDANDVRAAAARADVSVHIVAAEAVAAWQRLRAPRGRRPK